jgi:hypothetical protein
LEVVDEQVRQAVGLVAGQAVLESSLALTAVDPAVPLAVVVLVADPAGKAPAPLGRDDMHAGATLTLFKAIQVPLAEVSSLVAGWLKTSAMVGMAGGAGTRARARIHAGSGR